MMLLASCVGAAETVPSHGPHRKSFNMLQLSCYAFSGRGMGLVNVLVKNNPSCFLLPKVISTGLLIFRGKKTKFRGIFRGKFAEKSADFAGFLREKSQNSRHNRPTLGDFRGREVKIREKLAHFAGF